MVDARTRWDDPGWREPGDTAWAAGCRRLQVRWRTEVLGLPPGPINAQRPERLVGSMLPFDAPRDASFLSPAVLTAVDDRIAEGDHSGIIGRDRLMRNLLSSQPMCFNLFGPFVARPDALLGWVRSIDPQAIRVDMVRFEWAPDRAQHFGGGSAFDAFIEYSAPGSRFLAVECKYAENLAKSSITVRPTYKRFTDSSASWLTGASTALDVPSLKQFWLNTLLAQSLVERDDDYEQGTSVVVACAADVAARTAVERVQSQMTAPEQLVWSPYEDVVAAIEDDTGWREKFVERYLDVGLVAHLLQSNGSRLRT